MNLYLVHGHISTENSFRTIARWCGSQAESNATKKEFLGMGADKKTLKIDPVDVPVDKAGLMAFLNKGLEDQDGS